MYYESGESEILGKQDDYALITYNDDGLLASRGYNTDLTFFRNPKLPKNTISTIQYYTYEMINRNQVSKIIQTSSL